MNASYGPLPMSRPLADTMPAVTVPPRPKGLPTASTQSPIRALLSDSFANGKSESPSTLIRATSVRGSVPITFAVLGLAGVGRYFNLVRAIDDVVVGHRITIGRDKESGTLAHHFAVPTATAGTMRHAIGAAELTEETFHWRARSIFIALVAGVGRLLFHRDLD